MVNDGAHKLNTERLMSYEAAAGVEAINNPAADCQRSGWAEWDDGRQRASCCLPEHGLTRRGSMESCTEP